MSGWQDISTAPTGGLFDEIEGNTYEHGPDLLLTDGDRITIGSFEEGRWYVVEGMFFSPTHWMELPPLPREQEQAA